MPEKQTLNGAYKSIVTFFDYHLCRENQLSERVRKTAVSHIRNFCRYIQSIGISGFSSLRLKDVNAYIVYFGKTHNEFHPMLNALKRFNAFLKTRDDITCIDFEHVIIARPAKRRKLSPAFSKYDVEAILGTIKTQNRSSVKRDTAIVELAISTALRSIDIAELRLTDIDWNTSEIRINQHKTGRSLWLPLETIAGNAIADYILNERPHGTECPQVFLTLDEPFRKLKQGSINMHISTYFHGANIGYVPGSKMGFHSFRRYVASQMIDNNVELDTVREVLGTKHINSLKPYIRVSKEKLAACALGFENIPVLQEELI